MDQPYAVFLATEKKMFVAIAIRTYHDHDGKMISTYKCDDGTWYSHHPIDFLAPTAVITGIKLSSCHFSYVLVKQSI